MGSGFFGGLVFLAWPNKHPIQSEISGATHLDHFVDTVPVFVLLLAVALLCLARSVQLAPRLRRVVKKEHAAYHPLVWVPFFSLITAFVAALLALFAVGYPVAFLVVSIVIVGWGTWLHLKGRKSLERA